MFSRLKKRIKTFFYDKNLFLDNKKIILESSPDYSDNTKYVFDELLRRGLNKKFRLYWVTSGQNHMPFAAHHVFSVSRNSTRYRFIHNTAKYIIDSNNYVYKTRKHQYRLHLTHGMALKLPYDYSGMVGDFDCCPLLSDYFLPLHSKLNNASESKYAIVGSPRNDGLFNDTHVIGKKTNTKYIIWMPTFRNHKNKKATQTGISHPFCMPCVNTMEELTALNSCLKDNNVILILKPHPAEDLSGLKSIALSNIELFDESVFGSPKTQLYDILKDTDALITDYSSVYYDYLLLKRPIGLSIPDLDDYTDVYDLAEDNFKDFIKGSYIESFDDLLTFIADFSSGKLKFGKDMEWALNRYHKFKDGKSSSRVVDIIEKEMGRK